tara:strand:+ start:484 stop:1197 length:714 start_codon:yes stop_codon:yes gene_type:complete
LKSIDRKPSDKNTAQAINRIEQRMREIELKNESSVSTSTINEIVPTSFPSGNTPPYSSNGQLYVKSNNGDLYYKSVSGFEWKLNQQRWHRSSSFEHPSGDDSARMIPLAGGSITTSDTTPSDTEIADSYYIVPYDLKVTSVKGIFAREQALNSHPGNTTIKLYKTGTALSNAVTVKSILGGYDDTNLFVSATNTSQVFTWDLSKEKNTYNAGDVMHIEIDPTNKIYYASLTIIGEYI